MVPLIKQSRATVKRAIDRNFKPYAVYLNFKKEMNPRICVDGSTQVWVSKADALKIARDILKSLVEDE